MNLQGKQIQLRALEKEDIDFLYALENDTRLWNISNTLVPFSKYVLKQYIENAHLDIFEIKQLRLVIDFQNIPIGCIDLFDYNPQHHRAGIGIVLLEKYQGKGYALEAIELVSQFCFETLQLHQLYATITSDNEKSIRLFEQANFIKTGEKKDWMYMQGKYKNEFCYQLLNDK